MTTDSSQVMRVLDRCLATARSGSERLPGVAAAAARAKRDPDMHTAISLLLGADDAAMSWETWRRAVAAAREGRLSCPRGDGPVRRMLLSCQTASGTDRRTAAALAELFLAAIALELSSLGTRQGRRLRNGAEHGDVAAVRVLSSGRLP